MLLVIPLAFTIVANSSPSVITIYYNGTVEAKLYNVSQFILIGYNVTNLKVVGAQYNLSGNMLYLRNYTYAYALITYKAVFPKGVIQANENGNYSMIILLPINASISYIIPQPSSFTINNNFYNITFYTNKVTILYAFSTALIQKSNESNIELYLIGGLVGSDAILASLIFLVLRRNKTREEVDDQSINVDIVPNILDERDTIVLEAIKMGTNTLADIIRQTGLPKSTAYRRVKKLVKLGYIEEVREEGKIRYVLKKK
ncbi:transcriptional regulator [Sulfolobus sp. A20]|nr:transcriptional regulator [Sulfolobus sp. A20]